MFGTAKSTENESLENSRFMDNTDFPITIKPPSLANQRPIVEDARHHMNLIKPVHVLLRIVPFQVNGVHAYTLYIGH